MKVVNAVACAKFEHCLNLQDFPKILPRSAFYQQNSNFKRIAWKFKNATLMFFESGYVICLGAKGSRRAVQLLKKAVNILSANGFIVKLDNLKIDIVNLVACENLNSPIDLEELALKLSKCIYEPDQFPALIYRDDVNNATFLIFSNGKITVLGLKDESSARKALENFVKSFLEEKINECRAYQIS